MTMTLNSPSRTTPADGRSALAQLIVQLAAAQGCGLYVAQSGSHALVRQVTTGQCLADVDELQSYDLDRLTQRKDLALLPLYNGGLVSAVLILAFSADAEPRERGSLNRLIPLFETLVRFVDAGSVQVRLAAKISSLESEIASEKILNRVSGLIGTQGRLDESAIELAERHVGKVQKSCAFGNLLEDRLRELESLVAARDRTALAKELLQRHLGITEDEAYRELRTASRRQRKRLIDVAEEIISRYSGESREQAGF